MEELITTLENMNNPGKLDYLNLAIAILSFFVALVAIGLTVHTSKRQEKIAIYDNRKNVYKNVLKLQDFLCVLAIYEKRLKSEDVEGIKSALKNIIHLEIDISFAYELMEARFILSKKNKRIISNIANSLVDILRIYKMIKESVSSDTLYDKEDIDELYNILLPIRDDINELKEELESLLQY